MRAFWKGFNKLAKLKDSVQLQSHQERVKKKLDRSGGVLVFHGLGSGKTLTSLAATQGQKTDVVVPAALRTNYAKEVKLHTTGHKPNVMSYEKAVKTPPSGEALVIDEAHALGDSTSKRTQALLASAPHYKKRLLLTGTPIRNHPHEIAPLLRIARGDKKIPLDRTAFNDMFIREVRKNPGLLARWFQGATPSTYHEMKNRGAFADLARGHVDYHATSKEHFPSVGHEVVEIPMNKEQEDYYKFVMDKAPLALRYKIKRGLPPTKTEAKSLNAFLTGARQVANSTAPYGGKTVAPKIQTAVSRLTKAHAEDPNFKALVYSNFLDAGVKAYAKHLDATHIPYGIFSGELSDKKRKQMVSDYNSGKIKALLISGAGSQGLDLKGTKLVQLLEPHWNDARMEQAAGRAIRYKSHAHLPENERHVKVEHYHSTVAPGMFDRLRGKKDMSVDQYLDMLSKDKEKLNSQFTDVLKRVGGEP